VKVGRELLRADIEQIGAWLAWSIEQAAAGSAADEQGMGRMGDRTVPAVRVRTLPAVHHVVAYHVYRDPGVTLRHVSCSVGSVAGVKVVQNRSARNENFPFFVLRSMSAQRSVP
jgi:hypothetical protein